MKRQKIYLVTGTSGDYEERQEWAVCAFTDRSSADRHVRDLEEVEARVLWRLSAKRWERYLADEGVTMLEFREPRNRLDPKRPEGCVGATYHVQPVPLHTKESKDAHRTKGKS